MLFSPSLFKNNVEICFISFSLIWKDVQQVWLTKDRNENVFTGHTTVMERLNENFEELVNEVKLKRWLLWSMKEQRSLRNKWNCMKWHSATTLVGKFYWVYSLVNPSVNLRPHP